MMQILLCGGGNAIHVLSSYISARDDTHVTILSLFQGEAEKLRDAIPEEGIRCINDLGEDVYGKPDAVIGRAEDVPKDLDTVVFALPSFTHELYLKALKPYLKQGVTIGAMPGELVQLFLLTALHVYVYHVRCLIFSCIQLSLFTQEKEDSTCAPSTTWVVSLFDIPTFLP